MRSKAALSLVILLSVLALWQALRVRFDPSIEVYFVENDPTLVAYHEFLEVFDSDQVLIAAYEDPELWTPEGLAFLHRFGAELETVKHVQHVRSMLTSAEVRAEPGTIITAPYYDPDDPPDPVALRRKLLDDKLVRGSLISADGDVAALIVVVDHLLDEPRAKVKLARTMREIGARLGAERAAALGVAALPVHLAGPPMLDESFLAHTAHDTLLTFPLMGLMIIGSILLLFRSWRALPLPLSVVGLSCLWVAGTMGLLEYRLTLIHNIVFPMVMGVGIASSIHVLSRTVLLRRQGMDAHEAGRAALRQLWKPCVYTTLTTVAGMASLLFTSLRPLRQVGMLAALGITAALFLTYVLGPVLLPLLPEPADQTARLGRWWAFWDRAMEGLAEMAEHRAWTVLGVSALLLAVALFGLTKLQLGGNPVEYYLEDDPVRVDMDYVDSRLAGASTVDVFVELPGPDALKDPANLQKLVEVQEYLETVEGVGGTFSLADYLMELRQAVRGGAPEERRLPASSAEVSQLLLMIDDPSGLDRVVDFEFRRGRIHATVKLSDGSQLADRIANLEDRLAAVFPPPARARATGQSKLTSNLNKYLFQSSTRSMGAAFILVGIFMVLALGSVRLGLFSMIPNILPIGLTMGTMGWVGIPLDPGTTMVAAVALGLVVDDTVHFLHHFRECMAEDRDIEKAVRHTLHDSGRAIVMTSLILSASFFLMLLASFYPNIYFGLTCGLAILFALVADLVVLPAALTALHPRMD